MRNKIAKHRRSVFAMGVCRGSCIGIAVRAVAADVSVHASIDSLAFMDGRTDSVSALKLPRTKASKYGFCRPFPIHW